MAVAQDDKEQYIAASKKVWVIYVVAVICLVIFLVFVVAQDYQEIFFYSLMTMGASYAFRPNDEVINFAVKRLFGIDPIEKEEASGVNTELDKNDDM